MDKRKKVFILGGVLLCLLAVALVFVFLRKGKPTAVRVTCNLQNCPSGCCAGNVCQTPGFGVAGYSCIGRNKWQTPEGSVLIGAPKEVEEKVAQGGRLDEKAGCVFSLRYDKNGQINETLKKEALAEINKIRVRIDGGEKAKNFAYEITTSFFKYKTNPAENPYLKFNINQSFNFCFSNLEVVDNMMGEDFYNLNPVFKENLSGPNSQPFNIINNNKIDYAVMLITK